MKILKRVWLPLIIVVVVVVAGFIVNRIRGVWASHDDTIGTSSLEEDTVPFDPKRVVYEVFGPPGTIASINYLDVNAQPQRVDDTRLPWSHSVITTAPAVAVNIVAQGDSNVIGCRITVNDEIKDERTTHGVNAQTFCLVKSA